MLESKGYDTPPPDAFAVWRLDPAKYDPAAEDGCRGGALYPCLPSPPMLCTDQLGHCWVPQARHFAMHRRAPRSHRRACNHRTAWTRCFASTRTAASTNRSACHSRPTFRRERCASLDRCAPPRIKRKSDCVAATDAPPRGRRSAGRPTARCGSHSSARARRSFGSNQITADGTRARFTRRAPKTCTGWPDVSHK